MSVGTISRDSLQDWTEASIGPLPCGITGFVPYLFSAPGVVFHFSIKSSGLREKPLVSFGFPPLNHPPAGLRVRSRALMEEFSWTCAIPSTLCG